MPLKQTSTPYPLLDADPHFNRVVRYFRPSDYAVWAGATVAAPAALFAYERVDPSRHNLRPALKMITVIGAVGGFLLAYQRSSLRFWGWSENAREEQLDYKELSARAAAGKPLYGESDMPPFIQGAAHRNSAFSQLKFAAIPWFNFVSHPNHGTDPEKYKSKAE
ncbi:unnamed protein product [Rhizoctonia solani]|uniref:NADH-ubiquinone oxidoreductase 21 kDa subunit n=1 Tax=Rhizoctonia solani TaxID=456999 RepID=A0A8H2X3Y5_9AGAM|nr:unnamed protein product [Rhizoctonia solani]CAE6474418.1 unnamed protein product [Rhizoctonia solani]